MHASFNVAPAGHPILILGPQLVNGTVTAQAFSMKNAEHVSIGVFFGATPSPPTQPLSIVVNCCTNANGANATPLGSFRYYYQALPGAGNDKLNGTMPSSLDYPYPTPPCWSQFPEGITQFPGWVGNVQFWFEIDAAELEQAACVVGPVVEYPYLQVVINSLPSTYCAIAAILSGERYGCNLQASATV